MSQSKSGRHRRPKPCCIRGRAGSTAAPACHAATGWGSSTASPMIRPIRAKGSRQGLGSSTGGGPNSGPWPGRAAHFEGAHFNDCPRCAGIQAQPASWQGGKRPRKARRWRASPNRIISGQVQIGRLCRDLRYRFWRHLVSSGIRCLWRRFRWPRLRIQKSPSWRIRLGAPLCVAGGYLPTPRSSSLTGSLRLER